MTERKYMDVEDLDVYRKLCPRGSLFASLLRRPKNRSDVCAFARLLLLLQEYLFYYSFDCLF